MHQFNLSTLALAVLAALSLSACGDKNKSEASASATVTSTVQANQGDDASKTISVGTNKTYKTSSTVSATLMLAHGIRPALDADGVKLDKSFAYNVLYMGTELTRTDVKLKELGFRPEGQPDAPASTPAQIEAAKALKASLVDNGGMSPFMHRRLSECLDQVIDGDAAGGKDCLADYYVRLYALAGAMVDTWPQPRLIFEWEEGQLYSTDRFDETSSLFNSKELNRYVTSILAVEQLSMKLKSALAKLPPGLMRDDADVYKRLTDNLFAIPRETLKEWLVRPAMLKQKKDYELAPGAPGSAITVQFYAPAMTVAAANNGLSVTMNGKPYHGGDSGLLDGGVKDFVVENSQVASLDRKHTTSGQLGSNNQGSTAGTATVK